MALLASLASSCGPEEVDLYRWAKGCYTVHSGRQVLARQGERFAFVGAQAEATPFTFQPSDLATYLLYDPAGGYLVAEGEQLTRSTRLRSDVTELRDDYVSGAEWLLEPTRGGRLALRSRRTGEVLTESGLRSDPEPPAALTFEPARGCATPPELSLDARGRPGKTRFEDGELFGIVETHTHLFTNFGFGGFLFHGSPYHRLGVEHALPDCEPVHGPNGRRDFFGAAYDGGVYNDDIAAIIPDMFRGELAQDNHQTSGYPVFADWPDARARSTHQVQYHRWLERAYLAGLRLLVQHATSNSVICAITVGEGWTPSRYDCEDMTAVDRTLDEVYALERYLDAQAGGPGQGWFRVVHSPAEAREVIAEGKLAVVLGIETSDLFRCHLTPRPGAEPCTEATVDEQLDAYFARGVRALFPNHKYDNAFTPGDGSTGFLEAGNFLNSGHYTNKVSDCPTDVPPGFDTGEVTFGGLLAPRDVYLSPPAEDLSGLPEAPIDTLLPYALTLLEGPVAGDFCQNATLTPLGEHLLQGIMKRGMILEIDHLPRRSYQRAFELLQANNYPAAGTHGRDNYGKLYEVGGLAPGSFGRCHDPERPGATLDSFRERLELVRSAGLHPSLGLGFDLNGFAGAPGPRFGPEGCATPQEHPITYPFTSYDGAVTFTSPRAGERVFDFNTEGLRHVGLLPEWIQDLRSDNPDQDLEPLFRSAEGYLQMWERSEARGRALRGD